MLKKMNLAALDLGSNSFHLLVARASSSGSLTKLGSHKSVLRLGAVVQQHGRLPPPAFEQALEAVGQMAAVARAFRAERLVAVGTSALRDAKNGPEFCRAALLRHRVSVELISGREEGELVYRGARSAFKGSAERIAVVDIGGGSVEIAVGNRESCELVESLPLGFLRLAAQVDGATGEAKALAVSERALAGSREVGERLRALRPEAWVFSGGTARALGKLLIAGPSGVAASTVRHVASELGRSRPERLAELGVDDSRVDTLGLGAAIVGALVDQFGLSTLHISSGGLREGLLLRELAQARVAASPRDVQLASAPAWAL
jgi:exopolyphosphatase/guanosine-5'-triphosphate,3'-diphosphate pyrophosphatase